MGARANCVIIEQGHSHIFYDRWAAIHIPALLLAGPQGTSAKIRQMQPREQLTDTVWAEGGLVVNHDTQSVVYWGGEHYRAPHIRRHIAPLWQHLWPGWDMTWAVFGQPAIAHVCGSDPAGVIATEYDYHAFLFGDAAILGATQVVASPASLSDQRRLLSVRFAYGISADYTLGFPDDFALDAMHGITAIDAALTLGPTLAEHLTRLAPTPLLREDAYDGGVAIDYQRRQMLLWARFAIDERKVTAFQHRWPDWTITASADGPPQHMIALGRDPTPFLVPRPECLHELFPALIDYLPYAERDAAHSLLSQLFQIADDDAKK